MSLIDLTAVNLPNFNGEFEIGIAAGIDPTLSENLKLHVPASPPDRATAAKLAACWAYKTFRNEPELVGWYVVAAYTAVGTGIISLKDGDVVPCSDDIPFHVEVAIHAEAAKCISEYINSKNMSKILGLMCATKVNWWTMNHHTGQGEVTGYVKKYLNAIFSDDKLSEKAATTMAHTVGHWCSTKIILHLAGIKNIDPVKIYPKDELVSLKFTMDAAMRFQSAPAGTHKHQIAYTAAQKFVGSIAAQCCTLVLDLTPVLEVYKQVMADPARYHIGARYLTGKEREEFNDTNAQDVLGRLGSFLSTFYSNSTLVKSPHITKGVVKVYQGYPDYGDDFERLMMSIRSTRDMAGDKMRKKLDDAMASGGDLDMLPAVREVRETFFRKRKTMASEEVDHHDQDRRELAALKSKINDLQSKLAIETTKSKRNSLQAEISRIAAEMTDLEDKISGGLQTSMSTSFASTSKQHQ